MKNSPTRLITFLFLTSALVLSCKKKKSGSDPSPEPTPDPQEVITTFKLSLFDGSATVDYLFKDPDGDGGLPAFYGPGTTTTSVQSDSVIQLSANKTYTANIELLDETKSPVSNISSEIVEKANEHMFFFNQLNPSALPNASVSINGTNLSIIYLDKDLTPLPLGLSTQWNTGNPAGKKAVNIELKHQPNVKNGTYAPGDVDVSVLFKIQIN